MAMLPRAAQQKRDYQIVKQFSNRADDVRQESEDKNISIKLYTIDEIILNHLKNKIKPMVSQDGVSVAVPIIYADAERWKNIQQDGYLRDEFDRLQLPLIAIRRTDMKKNMWNSAVNKYQTYLFKSQYNKRNIYDKFAVLNGITPSEEYYTTMVPDYFDFTYEIILWTQYIEQMNAVTEAISFESNTYWGEQGNYKFRVEIDQFNQKTELIADKDRMVQTKASMIVHGYLLPEQALNTNGMKAAVTKIGYTPKTIVTFTEIVGPRETYATAEAAITASLDTSLGAASSRTSDTSYILLAPEPFGSITNSRVNNGGTGYVVGDSGSVNGLGILATYLVTGVQSYTGSIVAVDQIGNGFLVDGDQLAHFDFDSTKNHTFTVSGSTGNDGVYHCIGGSIHDPHYTEILVSESISSPVVNGSILSSMGPVTTYTLTTPGTLYEPSSNVPTTSNAWENGFTIDIITVAYP